MPSKAISIVQEANLDAAKRQYKRAQVAYYNKKEPIMTDAEFDKLEDSITRLHPDWEGLSKTGVPTDKVEVDHPEFMPSLNKAYPEAIDKWYAKYKAKEYVRMAKLDGSALAIIYVDGKPKRLITRGDGTRGGDVSHLIPALSIPKSFEALSRLNRQSTMVFRVEAIMKASVFEAKWSRAAKGDKGFDNGRNMVNGLFNRKTAHAALKDVSMVVLGVFGHSLKAGLATAKQIGFEVVPHVVGAKTDDDSKLLAAMRAKLDYACDGLVIAPSDFLYQYANSDKPKGIVAYKENDEAAAYDAEVQKIIWQVSGHGRIIPKVLLKPVDMGGVIVKHATVHNAKWMIDRGIGPKAQIKILRSGDVIPKIVDVIKKAPTIQMPEVEHTWQGVHLVVADLDNESTRAKRLLKFFQIMEIDGVALSTCAKLDAAGKTSRAIIKAAYAAVETKRNHMKAVLLFQEAGVAGANAVKIVNNLVEVFSKPLNLRQFMVASHKFDAGVGDRKLKKVEAVVPLKTLLVMKREAAIIRMAKIKGLGVTTAELIADGLEQYWAWQKPISALLQFAAPVKAEAADEKAPTFRVSFTGYRDKEQEQKIRNMGGEVIDFGSRTDVLLYKAGGKTSTKIAKAGSKAMTFEQFLARRFTGMAVSHAVNHATKD